MRFVPLCLAASLVVAGRGAAIPAGPAVPAVSKTTPAQQMIALYRDEYRHGFRPCPPPLHANEVVVCGSGRGGSAERIPLPDERTPPDWARLPTGEIPSAMGALNGGSAKCASADCPATGPVNLIRAATTLVQMGRAIVDPEAASDYADRHPQKPAQ
jgi:hypothetical protein